MARCHPQCSTPVSINGSTTLGELVIPARSLDYGLHEIKLTVAMTFSSQLTTSAVTYITIIPSPVAVNLRQLGPSMIIHGQQQTLVLDPGSHSIDPDSDLFNINVCVSHASVIQTTIAFLSRIELELHLLLPHWQHLALREHRRSNESIVFHQSIRECSPSTLEQHAISKRLALQYRWNTIVAHRPAWIARIQSYLSASSRSDQSAGLVACLHRLFNR